MIIEGVENDLIASTCLVIAKGQGGPALVVDPGIGARHRVSKLLSAHDLTVAAVLCTHGHIDHIWDAQALSQGTPVYVPGPDLPGFDNPLERTFGRDYQTSAWASIVNGLGPWHRPEKLAALDEQAFSGGIELAPGVVIRAIPAPGHSPGSTVFILGGSFDSSYFDLQQSPTLALSADVIFAGSVGRTDLPGSDPRAMLQSLRTLANVIDPQTILIPGHGRKTTMAQELATNVYLRQACAQG